MAHRLAGSPDEGSGGGQLAAATAAAAKPVSVLQSAPDHASAWQSYQSSQPGWASAQRVSTSQTPGSSPASVIHTDAARTDRAQGSAQASRSSSIAPR